MAGGRGGGVRPWRGWVSRNCARRRSPGASARVCGRNLSPCRRNIWACRRNLRPCRRYIRACGRNLRPCRRYIRACRRNLRPCRRYIRAYGRNLRPCRRNIRVCRKTLRPCGGVAAGRWGGVRGGVGDGRGDVGLRCANPTYRARFASITRERRVTCGGSEKPLLSRRAAQQRAGLSGAAV